MLHDEDIEGLLAPLRPIGYGKVPLAGEWNQPPFPAAQLAGRSAAMLCEDPGVAALVADRATGEVLLYVAPDDALDPVNSTLRRFVDCVGAYRRALARGDAGDDSDAVATALANELLTIDPTSVQGGNQLWSVACEELRRSPAWAPRVYPLLAAGCVAFAVVMIVIKTHC